MEENPRPDNNLPEPTPNNNQNFQKLIQDYIKYLNNQRSSGNWLPYLISIAIFLILIYGLANGVLSLVRPWMIAQQNSPPVTPSNPPTTTSPTPEPTTPTTPNPFQSVTFPQDVCGDQLPDDATAYPVSLYPIFVKYTEADLAKVQSQLCRDAFKKFRDKNNRDEIQVGSFLGTERASRFKEFISQTFADVEVGEATIIASKRETPTEKLSPSPIAETTFRADQNTFKDLEIGCFSSSQTIDFGNLEITCDTQLHIKNYSSDWYELQMNSGFITKSLAAETTHGTQYLLIPPGRTSEREDIYRHNLNGNTYQLKARKISQSIPSVTITVNCNDQPMLFWNIAMTPRCKPEGGTFIDLYTVVGNTTVSLDTGSGTPLVYEPSLMGQRGWISSENSKIRITFYAGRKQ
jgi:hypothetical protein